MSENTGNSAGSANESSFGGALKAILTTIIGLGLLLFGLVAVIPDEAGTNSSMLAIGALLAALGAGLVASVLLPHTIEVNGEKIQPLGVDVKASGGAAVFLIALGFIYLSNGQSIEAAKNASNGGETVAAEQTETSVGSEDGALAAEISDADEPFEEEEFTEDWSEPEAAIPLDTAPPAAATYVPGPGYLNNPYNDTYSMAPGLVRARTYCSTCCPMGPQMCAQAGGAASYDIMEAGQAAIALCIQRAGNPATCTANVEQF
ncbi:hypothetical protein INR77_03585 [Erythrobacter sp. SCSIO 43205]|uniref:hypothetical protein n=1 Tax=Erythrobacter sp. SCSIO 43205 TaxID=2779361 RepID=UPI001CA9AD4D|nr:hypothetical protein [Erythrobacter sp. SCSIO 43205]UAB78807.1 hypothetical protein INR77_03585 [Erythrobacter sp. SCSIO 43205]